MHTRKKSFLILLSLISLLLPQIASTRVAAEINKPAVKETNDISKHKALSESLIQGLATGDYNTIQSYFSNVTKPGFSPSEFKKTISNFGAYEKILGSMLIETSDARIVIMVLTKYSNDHLSSILVWEHGKITRFDNTTAAGDMLAAYRDLTSDLPYITGENCLDEEIVIGIYKLPGLITRPKDIKNEDKIFAIILPDSLQTDKDGTIGKNLNAPYRDLAAGLAQNGIVTVRWPNRDFLNWSRGTNHAIEEKIIDDAVAAIQQMRADSRFKDYKVFIIGHGFSGGVLAPVVARNTDADGWISMAGSPRSPWDVAFDTYREAFSRIFPPIPEFIDKFKSEAEYAKTLDDPESRYTLYGPARYIVSVNRLKHAEVAQKLGKPALILHPEFDIKCHPKKDYAAWQELLKGQQVQFNFFKDLNHLFMPSTKENSGNHDLENNMAPVAIGIIAAWLKEQTAIKSLKSEDNKRSTTDKHIKSIYQTLSESLAINLAYSNYKSVNPYLYDDIKAALTPKVLSNAFRQLAPLSGDYEKLMGSISLPASDNSRIILVFLQYSKSNLTMRFTWKDGKLHALWTSPATAADLEAFKNYYSSIPYTTGEGCLDEAIEVGIWKLPGLITRPDNPEKELKLFAIMIQGSGPNDKDETIGENRNTPFRDLAAGLAQRGITTVRWDKRYFQHPERAKEFTIQEEVLDDAAAAMQLMRSDTRFKDYKAFVIGHSLGGILAPVIAHDTGADGWISMAGSPRSLWQIALDQQIEMINKNPSPSNEAMILRAKKATELADALDDPDSKENFAHFPATYIVSLNRLKQNNVAKNLGKPALILQPELDFQVLAEKDYTAWQELLKGQKQVQFKMFKGLNHLFMPSSGIRDISDYDPKNSLAPEVIETIADWLTKQ